MLLGQHIGAAMTKALGLDALRVQSITINPIAVDEIVTATVVMWVGDAEVTRVFQACEWKGLTNPHSLLLEFDRWFAWELEHTRCKH